MYRKISSPSRPESVAQMIESIFALFISFFTIANWSFVPGSTFMVDMDAPCSAFRLNYSTMADERIVEGVKLLGGALREIMK